MKVNISKKAEKSRVQYRIEVRDHADGSPEVCNAVTAIMHGLVGYLSNRTDIGMGYDINEDRMSPQMVVWCGTVGVDEGIDAVWLMTAISLVQLEEAHPKAISVTGYLDLWPEGDDETNFIRLNELPADKPE